jgi:hypothetical protein
MDLALALVEDDLGSPMALKVARELVLYLRRAGGQSQFSTALSLQVSDRKQIEEVRSWALDNLKQDLTVEKLAAKANMSPRNFARVFLDDTGTGGWPLAASLDRYPINPLFCNHRNHDQSRDWICPPPPQNCIKQQPDQQDR